MEGVMLSMRTVTAGVVCLLVSGMAAGGAAAQSATNETPGKPIQLLQIVEQPNKPKLRHHAKFFARKAAVNRIRTHSTVPEEKPPHPEVETATAPVPANIWPAVNATAPTIAAMAEPAPQPVPSPVPVPTDPALGQLIVGGQTVNVASPDDINEIDLAAAASATPPSSALPNSATPSTPAMSDIAEPAPKSDSMKAAPAPSQSSEVGSTYWVLQVLAAFGGAVAAGSAAWFLIGSAPQRTYG
jgi:hypothetical protein